MSSVSTARDTERNTELHYTRWGSEKYANIGMTPAKNVLEFRP